MRRAVDNEIRPVVVVLGCGEIGSAIAHRLRRAGFAAVIVDAIDPPWSRRGMSFTDAWYVGVASLAGESAVFCASVRSIPAVLDRAGAVAATTWSARGIAEALAPMAVIDARDLGSRRLARAEAHAPSGIAVELFPGAGLPAESRIVPVRWMDVSECALREVRAPAGGRFGTARNIGDRVEGGEMIGVVAGAAIVAPVAGCLLGLAARGARVAAGAVVVEIDPRGEPARCFGLDPVASAMAVELSELLDLARARRAGGGGG